MPVEGRISVEVVYAQADEQCVIELDLPPAATAVEAVRRSGLLERYPEIDVETARFGLHGRLIAGGAPLTDGDRVEIYRPLRADPKQARRRRVLPRR